MFENSWSMLDTHIRHHLSQSLRVNAHEGHRAHIRLVEELPPITIETACQAIETFGGIESQIVESLTGGRDNDTSFAVSRARQSVAAMAQAVHTFTSVADLTVCDNGTNRNSAVEAAEACGKHVACSWVVEAAQTAFSTCDLRGLTLAVAEAACLTLGNAQALAEDVALKED